MPDLYVGSKTFKDMYLEESLVCFIAKIYLFLYFPSKKSTTNTQKVHSYIHSMQPHNCNHFCIHTSHNLFASKNLAQFYQHFDSYWSNIKKNKIIEPLHLGLAWTRLKFFLLTRLTFLKYKTHKMLNSELSINGLPLIF